MSTEQFPLVKKLGLHRTPVHGDARDFILMSDLERLLESLPVLTGKADSTGLPIDMSASHKSTSDTHTMRGILIEPINKPVSKQQIIDALESARRSHPELRDLAISIERDGVEG